mmetsp:Transcript_8410/g.35163  ORF Transcript_8410/g.35163 Transcript_8410/m.35163 type:complete len:201 (-) Transcript_8410:323-925(-)
MPEPSIDEGKRPPALGGCGEVVPAGGPPGRALARELLRVTRPRGELGAAPSGIGSTSACTRPRGIEIFRPSKPSSPAAKRGSCSSPYAPSPRRWRLRGFAASASLSIGRRPPTSPMSPISAISGRCCATVAEREKRSRAAAASMARPTFAGSCSSCSACCRCRSASPAWSLGPAAAPACRCPAGPAAAAAALALSASVGT